mmetsp:Transcript_6320/g.5649  ORF Transcript_6320/g.5649 Transcript_6320/m.5649 type:complete len:101 (+) Transcript_6320:652-954(+)
MVDYAEKPAKNGLIRDKAFKDMILDTLSQRKKLKLKTKNEGFQSPLFGGEVFSETNKNSMIVLDQILEHSQNESGIPVFKRGRDLRNGLIDIEQLFKIIQ